MTENVVIDILTDKRVLLLILLTLGAVGWIFINGGPFNGGLKFGIDFSGGVRIPILLEQAVDPVTMQEMVDNIKTRASAFGLSEVKVTPVGDSQIFVEVSKANPQLVTDIERILSKQGVYQGIVDGKVAVSGDSLYPDTVRRDNPAYYGGVDWVVAFSLTSDGQKHFSEVVRGKGNFPLYMYLDRPTNAIVVISKEDLLAQSTIGTGINQQNITEEQAIKLVISALNLEGHSVPIYLEEGISEQIESDTLKPFDENTAVIISKNSSEKIKGQLTSLGFKLKEKSSADMQPVYAVSGTNLGFVVNRWDALGLKSAPILSPSIANGAPSQSYVITGAARGKGNEKIADADLSAREIMSVLKGGALPVQISLGSVQEVPAKLGQEVLNLSLLGLVFSVICIAVMLSLRYREPSVVLPIVLTSISEIILLLAIIGSFSIDLAAMAGIIATVGISVDAQIVITDELLKKREDDDIQHKLDGAFHIIVTNATVAIVAMLPLLLFSGLVEIIGFATTTVIGYILGVSISRPAYATVAKKLFVSKKAHEKVAVVQ
ncbi:MAG: hypothetical protein WC492_01470 [Candidatus Micrarchaeia archaeon]